MVSRWVILSNRKAGTARLGLLWVCSVSRRSMIYFQDWRMKTLLPSLLGSFSGSFGLQSFPSFGPDGAGFGIADGSYGNGNGGFGFASFGPPGGRAWNVKRYKLLSFCLRPIEINVFFFLNVFSEIMTGGEMCGVLHHVAWFLLRFKGDGHSNGAEATFGGDVGPNFGTSTALVQPFPGRPEVSPALGFCSKQTTFQDEEIVGVHQDFWGESVRCFKQMGKEIHELMLVWLGQAIDI